jgi:hypothetical protein
MSAKKAIEIAKKTGKLTEAVSEALRGHRVHELKEEFQTSKQTQVFHCANQDALNQLLLRIEDKLPDATYTVADYDNGSISGFAVTVTGEMNDEDIASLGAKKGVARLDGPNQDLAPKA